MLNGKMCVCVSGDEMMCRIGAAQMEMALEQTYCRQMIHNRRPNKDFVFVNEAGFKNQKDFDHWINRALDFNPPGEIFQKEIK